MRRSAIVSHLEFAEEHSRPVFPETFAQAEAVQKLTSLLRFASQPGSGPAVDMRALRAAVAELESQFPGEVVQGYDNHVALLHALAARLLENPSLE